MDTVDMIGLGDDKPRDTSPTHAAMCRCGDRAMALCPGEWEPGCDLGANEKHAKAANLGDALKLAGGGHDWRDAGIDTHKGEYWYRCARCGASDWIASYGTMDQLMPRECDPPNVGGERQ